MVKRLIALFSEFAKVYTVPGKLAAKGSNLIWAALLLKMPKVDLDCTGKESVGGGSLK